jgi:hypothetical protein
MASYFGFNELRRAARENRAKAQSYRKQAKRTLKFLPNTLNKSRRIYILECYVRDLKEAREYETLSRTCYACANTWPKEDR